MMYWYNAADWANITASINNGSTPLTVNVYQFNGWWYLLALIILQTLLLFYIAVKINIGWFK